MGWGSEFSKKASAHLHCIVEMLRVIFNESLEKICIEMAVFYPSKAG